MNPIITNSKLSTILFILCFFINFKELNARIENSPNNSKLEFLKDFNISTDFKFKDLLFGGISGACVKKNDLYLVSDDRGPNPPARFYRAFVDLDIFESKNNQIPFDIREVIFMNSSQKDFFVDAETMLCEANNDTFLVSSEANLDPNNLHNSKIYQMNLKGNFEKEITLNKMFKKGMRNNAGFEALIYHQKNKDWIWGIPEEALFQDNNTSDLKKGSMLRLSLISKSNKNFVKNWWYPLEKVPSFEFKQSEIDYPSLGVSDMAWMDSCNAWVLERVAIRLKNKSWRNSAKIYEINLCHIENSKPKSKVSKKLVLDLEEIIPKLSPNFKSLDNLEVLVPLKLEIDSPEKNTHLLLISDNNFNPTQRTQILTFKLSE